LSVAVDHARLSKDYLKNKEYELAMKHAGKAAKQVETLVSIRRDSPVDYFVLNAPFIYLLAHTHITYIELETDTMGALAPLFADADSDSEDEGEEVGGEAEAEPINNAEEPKIEEEVQQINTSSLAVEEDKEEEKNGGEKPNEEEQKAYADIAFEESYQDVSLAIQIIEDFLSKEAGDKQKKFDLFLNLLIDCYLRRAELFMTSETNEEASADFKKVTELCALKIRGNERIQASAYYHLGYIEQLLNKPQEAKGFFLQATEVIKELLCSTL
jgi:hypothetical protein